MCRGAHAGDQQQFDFEPTLSMLADALSGSNPILRLARLTAPSNVQPSAPGKEDAVEHSTTCTSEELRCGMTGNDGKTSGVIAFVHVTYFFQLTREFVRTTEHKEEPVAC
jgi:hypothetical protein